jgi:Uncharacterised protein family (UPF0158)
MAMSFFQKLRLGFRGWSRRRAEESRRKREEFLQRDTAWSKPAVEPVAAAAPKKKTSIDVEGLQVAYLDDSGRIEHYLDLQSGEVVEFPSAERARHGGVTAAPQRYRRVPTRDPVSEAADRELFAAGLEVPAVRTALAATIAAGDGAGFRRVLSGDRTLERGWYNFKNDRALAAIEAWLREIGAN